ncbi:hypothetical protein [Bradyrhizobium aeschynomenes]|uniref:hypothetical protein n=1 Tax=Bradyrhizobium aeschynomenes TaxID=2734909 RepID=UPI001AEEA62D|nr:hypothetical protein [Bradyrhizobium aeschynomenes]
MRGFVSRDTQREIEGKFTEGKEEIFHTLCTSGADASRAACGYLIGVKQTFALKRCLHELALVNTAILPNGRQIKARQSLAGVWVRIRTKLPVSLSIGGAFPAVRAAPTLSALAIQI